MSHTFKVALVQNCAGASLDLNLEDVDDLVRGARAKGADLICLPEYFSCLDVSESGFELGAHAEQSHPALPFLRALAKELKVWLNLGSLAIKTTGRRVRNRSYLIDADGRVVARYDKIHLFDVDLAGGESYRESDKIDAGSNAVLSPTPWGPLGFSICYDLRFAQLYRTLAQAGAMYMTVPAAFTRKTGEAHWHTLLRARAIETGSYVFAACQYGRHGNAETYGHSLVVDPWGEVVVDAGENRCFVIASVDPRRVQDARRMIPALRHDREFGLQSVEIEEPARALA